MGNMRLYWQSKIFALLHDPVFKPFDLDKAKSDLWRELDVMQDWQDIPADGKLLNYLINADYISAASDRTSISSINNHLNYNEEQGLEIAHLLSGAKQQLKGSDRQTLVNKAASVAQVQHQLQDPRSDRHVEHRHRFIGHDELGLEDHGCRDRDALTLAT